MSNILTSVVFPSVVHNNEICDELVIWSQANNYPINKAKLYHQLDAYVGFAPEYLIKAVRKPPIPGGWDVTVESYDPEERIIPLNVDPATGEVNRFIIKMIEEYRKEGLSIELLNEVYESYGTHLRDLKVSGHPQLLNSFEDFVENMR
jgi:hypothetical protein